MSALGLAEIVPTAEPLSIIDALEELVVSVKSPQCASSHVEGREEFQYRGSTKAGC